MLRTTTDPRGLEGSSYQHAQFYTQRSYITVLRRKKREIVRTLYIHVSKNCYSIHLSQSGPFHSTSFQGQNPGSIIGFSYIPCINSTFVF
ncbi:UNVERIFIED_CONTAM: hypothetical protein FKN15_061031 [Acipenser sinensis]